MEYTPDGYTDVYRWDDFLVIAGDHVYSAMDTIDSVSPGGEYEGFDPQYAYTCEIVGCGDLFDGCALFRPVSHDGEDYIQIAFLRSDIDDSTGEYTERFEAGSFDMPAADALRFDLAVDLMDYFSGRTFEGEPGVSRGLEPREAVAAVEGATGCDLNFFEDFWLGSPGEIVESVHVGPYTKQSLLDFSYYAKELSRRYGFADSDILEIARHLPEECPDRFAAVKAYLDCEYVPDGDAPDEKTYRWGDFLEIAGGDARYAAMLVDRTAAGEPEEGLHPETLVDQDIRDGEAFMLAGRPIAPEDAYDLPGTVHGLYKELVDNVDQSGVLFRDWRGFAAGTDADDVLRAIEAAFGETEYSRAGTVLGAYADDTFMSSFYVAVDDTRDVTPLTPWEDEDGVAFLSRTLDADAGAPVPCLWYCMRDGEQGFEVGGVKLDCSKIGFDEVAAAAASNGIDSVLAYLGESPHGLEPLCDIAVRRVDAGMPDAVRHFGSRDEAMAMLGAITGCRVQAYGVDTLTYRASLGNAAAAKLAAGRYQPGLPRLRRHRRGIEGKRGDALRRGRVAGLVLHRSRRSGPRRGDLRRRLPFRMPCRYRRHLRGAHREPGRAARLLRPDGGRPELRPDLLLPARVHRAGGRAAVRGRGRFPHPIRRGARYRGFRRHARTHVGARRGRRREGVDLRLRLLLVRDRRTRFQPRAGALPRRDRGRLGCRAERESI